MLYLNIIDKTPILILGKKICQWILIVKSATIQYTEKQTEAVTTEIMLRTLL